MRPTHLSVSSVQLYARCPAAWKRRYIDDIHDPPTPPMAFGRAMANALEALHRGEDAEVVFAREHAAALVVGISPPADYGLRLLRLYRERGVFAGTPERRFELYLPDRVQVPVPIVGFFDLETDRGVVEFKTSRAAWTQGRVANEAQAAVYGWAYQRLHGRRPDGVTYVVMSTRIPMIEVFEAHPSGSDLLLFELQAITVWKGITQGRFDPCGRCEVCQPQQAGIESPGLTLVVGT